MKRPLRAVLAVGSISVLAWAPPANAHHEALFVPQSSLAVESDGFVSLQAHEHVFGLGSTHDQETAYQVDLSRARLGSIYSFSRAAEPPVMMPRARE